MAVLVAGVSFREGRAGARARWQALGLRPRWVEVREALVAGVAGLAVLGLLEWAAGSFAGVEIGPPGVATERQVAPALKVIREHPWLTVGLVSTAGVIEEVVYRGWGLLLVRRARPSATLPALAGSSLLFGAAHLLVPVGGFLHYSLLGLVFGFVALVAGSIVPGALLHGAMNAVVAAIVAWGAG
jgi:membrane protease YdiL (CAAX protease family)